MYKVLLCLRMLRQRRITWLCIAGVALGLGALIVVHSVMGGFAGEVRSRIRGTLGDMSLSRGQGGFAGYEAVLAAVRSVEGVAAAAPVLEGFAIIRMPGAADLGLGSDFTRWCVVHGIDLKAELDVSRIAEWRVHDPNAGDFLLKGQEVRNPVILGSQLNTARIRDEDQVLRELPIEDRGDTVILSTVAFSGAGGVTSYDGFVVVDTWNSRMSELDAQTAFVPLEAAQALRKMPGRVTKIHLRLTDYRQHDLVRQRIDETLRALHLGRFTITTWEEERGTLLAAVAVEQNLMVILLFLIIVVAGFSIMAILNMIVADKVRDIGIIRALGGSKNGVAAIFLSFGLVIGVVGCVLGTIAGLLFTRYINSVESLVQRITGYKVFNPEIYYFDRIPTEISPISIVWFIAGILAVCLAMSALPARKAAGLEPVEAIRYE